jgi:hypothetical protein
VRRLAPPLRLIYPSVRPARPVRILSTSLPYDRDKEAPYPYHLSLRTPIIIYPLSLHPLSLSASILPSVVKGGTLSSTSSCRSAPRSLPQPLCLTNRLIKELRRRVCVCGGGAERCKGAAPTCMCVWGGERASGVKALRRRVCACGCDCWFLRNRSTRNATVFGG